MRHLAALVAGAVFMLGLCIVAACSVVGLALVVAMIRVQRWIDPVHY